MKLKPAGAGNTTAAVCVWATARRGGKEAQEGSTDPGPPPPPGPSGGSTEGRAATPGRASLSRGGTAGRGCRPGPGRPSPASPVPRGRPQPGPCPPSRCAGAALLSHCPPADSPTAERGCGPAGAASSAEQSSARPRAKRAARPPHRSMSAVPGAPCPPTAAHVTAAARRKGASPQRLVQAPALRCLPGAAGSRRRAPPARPGAKSRPWPGPSTRCRAAAPEGGGGGGSCRHLSWLWRGSGWPSGGATPGPALARRGPRRSRPGRGQGYIGGAGRFAAVKEGEAGRREPLPRSAGGPWRPAGLPLRALGSQQGATALRSGWDRWLKIPAPPRASRGPAGATDRLSWGVSRRCRPGPAPGRYRALRSWAPRGRLGHLLEDGSWLLNT